MTAKDDLFKLGLLSDEPDDLGYISTGSLALNWVISDDFINGGVPIGGITEFYGKSSTAKTVFVTCVLINAQKMGFHTKLIDTEQSYKKSFAKDQGMDLSKLYYSTPLSLEDVFIDIDRTIDAIRKEDPDTPIVIGVDSLAVCPVNKEVEGNYDQAETMGMIRAKTMGACLRKINGRLRRDKVALLVVNQVREKMVMFGSPETKAAGGNSLEFYCSVCLKTTSSKGKSDMLRSGGPKSPIVGIKGTVMNTKNKVATPFRSCDFELMFDKGLVPEVGLVDVLAHMGLIDTESVQGWCLAEEQKFRKKDFMDKVHEGLLPEIAKLLKIEPKTKDANANEL